MNCEIRMNYALGKGCAKHLMVGWKAGEGGPRQGFGSLQTPDLNTPETHFISMIL
jgi:hypothetical protein